MHVARDDPKTTWHSVLSFNQNVNNYLRMLKSGSQVYVEANFELREPDPNADPDSPQGQRQIFLRHGWYNVGLIGLQYLPFHRDHSCAQEPEEYKLGQ